MKCNLNLLEQNNIKYSFATLLVAMNYGIINNADVANYTTQYLLKHPHETDPIITELVCINSTAQNVENMLIEALKKTAHIIEPNTNEWIQEERKLRFCLLLELKQTITNKRELLEKIAEIYADFNYFSDMENFIYYMPAKNYDPTQHSLQENENRLINLFDKFLRQEKIELQHT